MASFKTSSTSTTTGGGFLDDLLVNVHSAVSTEYDTAASVSSVVSEMYQYFHYLCDGIDDRGWGCGYRTLQSMCSWISRHPHFDVATSKHSSVPSIKDIQEALVAMQDKPDTILGSKQWIGSFEVFLCLDYFYDVSCKIIHVSKGSELVSVLGELHKHFSEIGAPVMMGGETDNASKGIMGVRLESEELLIVDPHFCGKNPTKEDLRQSGFVKWMPVSDLHAYSFYNLCLPKPSWR